ncbi:type II secretion system F family protein [Streptomyces albidoflavus]|uniref:type II secretion system F family protein n=1 Tax=Streptomyces TaxID=1883 RepID=UPI00211E98E3|nr:type II secretion system F family protein [Streptomyces sp. BSP1]MCQ9706349.1 type II secretion system F family protein [Streptomyces sp. BSP1]
MSADLVHRLGATLWALVLLAGWGASVRARRATRARWRGLHGAVPAGGPSPVRAWAVGRRAAPVWGVAGVAVGWLVGGGALEVIAGGAAGWWGHRWAARREAGRATGSVPRPGRRPPGLLPRWARGAARPTVGTQLPLAADLVAACVAAGAGPVEAARAVGASVGGPVGQGLGRAAADIRLGGDPEAAWRHVAEAPGASALARCLQRAAASGAPAAEPLARIAAEARADWNRAATERARRAAVAVTAPVGLCFLPAFLALGVAPVVIGLASGLLRGGG